MEDVYDICQHSHCLFIYLDSSNLYSTVIYTLPSNPHLRRYDTVEATMFCDKQKKYGLENCFQDEIADSITINNFKDELYRIFEKGKERWDDDDNFFIKAVSDFIYEVFETYRDYENTTQVHHVFIVPSEWNKEIREELIRPLYIEAGLISKDDHNDRLLFFSEVECIFFDIQQNHHFERGQYTVLSRVNNLPDNVVTIKLDLVRTMNTLFNFSESKLVPYVVNSLIVYITPQRFRGNETTYTETKMAALTAKEGPVVHSLVQDLYENMEKLKVNMYNLTKYTNASNYEGTETIEIFLDYDKSFEDSCIKIEKAINDAIKNVVQNNFLRDYRFVTLFDKHGQEFGHNSALNNLIKSTWIHNTLTTNGRPRVSSLEYYDIEPSRLFSGAAFGAFETIKNCSMNYTPSIRIEENPEISPSTFSNSKPSTIINIDLSCKSTLLSFSDLNDNGSIESIYDYNHVTGNKSLLSICEVWSVMPLDKKENIFNSTFTNQDLVRKQEFILTIEQILKDSSKKKTSISILQQRYMKKYIMEYVSYIKLVIINGTSSHINPNDKNINIGYVVSIEKIMLENLIGTKEDLQEVIYASGLINKMDESKKLVVITQGEGLLPTIKQSVKLDFPIKTYFVLAQLYEDSIQLRLNRVVTTCIPGEKEQESIVIQEEIIPIINIYKSLCVNMWKNIVEERSLIRPCSEHESCDDSEIFQLFSIGSRNKFMKSFEAFISDNIFKENLNIKITDENVIEFSNVCECKVCLTIYDVIQVSFKPVLRDIATTVSASLKNNELFGNYLNIKYAFNMIYFNLNSQFRPTIEKILSDETKTYHIEEGIETECLVISEPSNYFLLPNVEQQRVFSRNFQDGTLQQMFSQSYCFKVIGLCVNDESHEVFFPIVRSGDIISKHKYNRVAYVKIPENFEDDSIDIRFYIFYNLKNSEPISTGHEYFYTELESYSMKFDKNNYRRDYTTPITISLKTIGYTSSLAILAYFVGKDTLKSNIFKIREPMLLTRF